MERGKTILSLLSSGNQTANHQSFPANLLLRSCQAGGSSRQTVSRQLGPVNGDAPQLIYTKIFFSMMSNVFDIPEGMYHKQQHTHTQQTSKLSFIKYFLNK